MNINALPSEDAAVVATIDPVSLSTNTHDSDYVDMSKFHRLMAVVQTGVLGANATFDAKLQHASDTSDTGLEDITGKAITQIVKATGDNKQAIINLTPEEMKGAALNINNGARYVRLRITVATNASIGSAVLLGFSPRHAPADDSDLSSVAEIVA